MWVFIIIIIRNYELISKDNEEIIEKFPRILLKSSTSNFHSFEIKKTSINKKAVQTLKKTRNWF